MCRNCKKSFTVTTSLSLTFQAEDVPSASATAAAILTHIDAIRELVGEKGQLNTNTRVDTTNGQCGTRDY